jgi:hypothetical protein
MQGQFEIKSGSVIGANTIFFFFIEDIESMDDVLDDIAQFYQSHGDNVFKTRAYSPKHEFSTHLDIIFIICEYLEKTPSNLLNFGLINRQFHQISRRDVFWKEMLYFYFHTNSRAVISSFHQIFINAWDLKRSRRGTDPLFCAFDSQCDNFEWREITTKLEGMTDNIGFKFIPLGSETTPHLTIHTVDSKMINLTDLVQSVKTNDCISVIFVLGLVLGGPVTTKYGDRIHVIHIDLLSLDLVMSTLKTYHDRRDGSYFSERTWKELATGKKIRRRGQTLMENVRESAVEDSKGTSKRKSCLTM